jgi:putative membrane protein
MKRRVVVFAVLLAACAVSAFAHEGRPPEPHDVLTAWTLEPAVIIGLLLSAWLYWRGSRRMRKNAVPPHRWESMAFTGGLLALVVALVSPLDAMGGALFSAHMMQHEVLMLVAAPLLVFGRPLAPFLLALPAGMRRDLVGFGKLKWVQRTWRLLVNPLVAWLIHGAVLWAWHAPLLFQATLENEWIHAAQHLSFLVSALLFCEAIVHGRDGRLGYGAGVVYLFTTAVHTSVLGALLTFSGTLWYPVYQQTTLAWGLTPIDDQQLGGLIMWVPAGLVYIVAGLVLFTLWLRESELAVVRQEKRVRGLAASTGRTGS